MKTLKMQMKEAVQRKMNKLSCKLRQGVNMKYKGFTLIELVIVISIAASVFWGSMNIIKSCKRIKNNTEYKGCSNSILRFIQSSKEYCRKNYAAGRIYVNENGILCFTANNTIIKRLRIPEGFNTLHINTKDGRIIINEAGLVSSACTISYNDREKENHNITIWVGTFCADIKE